MAKPTPGIIYHASPKDNLHSVGLDPCAKPCVTRTISGWIYLGSDRYILDQYLKYAKKGTYYVYMIETAGLEADDTPLAGDQQRYGKLIPANRVKQIGLIDTTRPAYLLKPIRP